MSPNLDPRTRDALLAAGLEHQRARRFHEAERCYQLVLRHHPRDPEALYRMGVLALQCANGPGAVHYLRHAGAVRDFDADACYNLGMAHVLDHGFGAARQAFERALALESGHASAAVALGNVHRLLGDYVAAGRAYVAAVRAPHVGPTLFSQILIGLHTNPAVTAAELFELHCIWAQRYAERHYPAARQFANDADPVRRLRLGLVSPKFTADIVGQFLCSVVPALARRVDLFLYHAGTVRDWVTDELAAAGVAWRTIAGLDDAAAAASVTADGIDVLVDLAGHAPGNRLLMFARRPAPVQITWLDYFDTTGLATMDVIVSDPVTSPPALVAQGAQRFVERLAYVPHTRLVYRAPPFAPPVSEAPVARAGHVTFGCFGRADKVHGGVVALWASVLLAVPGSRLVLKGAGYEVAPVRERVASGFAVEGVAPDRITFLGASEYPALLADYAKIDIGLDTFPYNGGATTCDALWMGVPVVTLAGETMIARQGASLLTAAGLSQCIAEDARGFVAAAVGLAADGPALANLRASLRGRLAASPLCDAEGFADAFVAIAREAWQRWCALHAGLASGLSVASGRSAA